MNGPLVQPQHIGRVILIGAAVLIAGLAALVVLRDQPIRPELSAVPLPQGAVTHAAVEDCRDGEPTVCVAYIAVGPAGGIELPRETEVMLSEHLRDQGWAGSGGELTSPTGRTRVHVTDYDPQVAPGKLEANVDEDVVREDLALVEVIPIPSE